MSYINKLDILLETEEIDDEDPSRSSLLKMAFGRYAPQASKLLELSGCQDVIIILSKINQGAFFGYPNSIYITNKASDEHKLFLFGHELGHAHRNKHHGPIYNLFILKDPSGKPISIDEAAEAVSFEEREACRLSSEWFSKIGMANRLTHSDHGASVYRGWLKNIAREGFTSLEEVSDYFLKSAGG